jgi:hypothetical protein
VTGNDPAALARALVDELGSPALRIAFVFADRRLDPTSFAGIGRSLSAPVVGCAAPRVLGPRVAAGNAMTAVGLGLYGDWVRVGVGVAPGLSKAALSHSREAVYRAAAALGTTVDALEPGRHVAITLFDAHDSQEAFCIGSAAFAPRIRFVGGGASSDTDPDLPTPVWANGELLSDAGVVVVLDSDHPVHAVTSSHLVPTECRTVVTSATGCVIEELDGRPAAPRLRQLIASLGDKLEEPRPLHAFARYIDGVPCVRAFHSIAGTRLVLASAVETGQVLRVMQPGDLLGTTKADLGLAAQRVGGTMAAFLAFSSMGRHTEEMLRGRQQLSAKLASVYASYPTIGFQSRCEQSCMLLVNHTLTGLAIGGPKR